MTYQLCKRLIERKKYSSKEDMQQKLDTFMSFDRITQEQYTELSNMLQTQE